MIGNLLMAVGVICLILGLLALFGVLLVGKAALLLIVAVICLVLGYFLGPYGGRRARL